MEARMFKAAFAGAPGFPWSEADEREQGPPRHRHGHHGRHGGWAAMHGRGPRGGRGGWGGPGGFGGGPPWGQRSGGRRRRRGDVRAAVLALLLERPMHGYEMIQELESRTEGNWR